MNDSNENISDTYKNHGKILISFKNKNFSDSANLRYKKCHMLEYI